VGLARGRELRRPLEAPRDEIVASSSAWNEEAARIPHACPYARCVDEWFRRFAHATAEAVGRSQAFLGALFVILLWAITGPFFHFSDTWQLVINTGTTIVTFLMVFLIQNTQNRDAHAIHLKLDELIRANIHARNALLGLESMSDAELARLQIEFEKLRDRVAAARESQASARDSRNP
jgi:low affinity Fe/Cu permease